MRDLFVKIKNLSLITIGAFTIIGIILLIKPDEALQFVSIMCGATILALGIGAWVSYLTKIKSMFLPILGTLSIIAGIILCVQYRNIIKVVVFMFGLFILIGGIFDLISVVDAKRNDLKSWIFSLIMSIATVILGLIVIINPFGSGITMTRLLGAGLLVYAVMDLISFIQVKKIVKFAVNDQIDVESHEHND